MKPRDEIGRPPSDDELATRWKELHPNTVYSLGCFRRCTDGNWADVSAIQVKAEILNVLIGAKSEGIRPSNVRINSVVEMSMLLSFSPPPSNENHGVREFLESCCVIGAEYQILPGSIHYAYLEWSVANGYASKSEDQLWIDLKLREFTMKYVDGRSYWTGITLKSGLDPEKEN